MKILIIKPSSLGDILHTFPAVELILRHCPDAEISWIANENLGQVVSLLPGIKKCLLFPRGSISRMPAFVRELRRETYDAVLDFQGLLRSGVMAAFAKKTQNARIYGFSSAREGAPLFYTEKVTPPAEIVHALDKNLFLASRFLGIPFAPASSQPRLEIPAWAMKSGLEKLQISSEKQPVLGVGFSSRWKSKNWPLEFFADILNALSKEVPELKIWLLGGPEDSARGEKLLGLLDSKNAVNLAGKTSLMELTALLACSQALLTNDSGPMHIASALAIPCVALFGATSPKKTGPYGTKHTIVRSQCRYSPCFKRECPHPLPGGCCNGISAEAIACDMLRFFNNTTYQVSP